MRLRDSLGAQDVCVGVTPSVVDDVSQGELPARRLAIGMARKTDAGLVGTDCGADPLPERLAGRTGLDIPIDLRVADFLRSQFPQATRAAANCSLVTGLMSPPWLLFVLNGTEGCR